ncbi:hypothetical protein AB0L25_26110 [Spirillospora sp. NPDC052242]
MTRSTGAHDAFANRADEIVALVDHRLCGLAAVRHAIRLVPHRGSPLTVVMLRRPLPALASFALLNSGGVLSDGSVRDDRELWMFGRVAELLAPSLVPWDFRVADGDGGLARIVGGSAATVVVSGHPVRPRRRALRIPPGAGRGQAGAASLVVVGCGRAARRSCV